ncbi:hypothetical protein LOK49_LG05G03871 [Camellia lanceoleosa]|uniref:Uncharacterized protein n=1 Tax=Camellia lanceoleosa TaxID=1840588 RepID=A0ACC0HW11_9ERIC|nr:hypothetical protein LOK49_LG05G03871 [Camellia lanceoleosa]
MAVHTARVYLKPYIGLKFHENFTRIYTHRPSLVLSSSLTLSGFCKSPLHSPSEISRFTVNFKCQHRFVSFKFLRISLIQCNWLLNPPSSPHYSCVLQFKSTVKLAYTLQKLGFCLFSDSSSNGGELPGLIDSTIRPETEESRLVASASPWIGLELSFLSTLQLISNAKDLNLSPKKNSIPGVPQEILFLSLVILHPQECWMMSVVFTAFLHSVDTVIANEKDWGIDLLNENVNEFGTNEDGSSWYQENGKDLGENGYRCRWTRMGGQSHDGSLEWKERWWEKSDWIGYNGLGVKKSGRNAEGDLWWETWQEVLHQDEWRWEKYDAEGWTEKGAHKYGRLNEQSWWEKTDKWAETELGTEWGDKWEKYFAGIGLLQGETWHVLPGGDC